MDAGKVLFRGVLISSEDLHTLTVKKDEEKAKRRDRLFHILSALIVAGMYAFAAIIAWQMALEIMP